ncbi:MAG: hypothetical protein A2Y25_06095 [Candidatus Melainabacteria bacterium GWF2_37_15]|nr:MAG: hypothetical protein A2Y25_06095 [Candidatus Melainabacteria bacterium GWF2_37_15]
MLNINFISLQNNSLQRKAAPLERAGILNIPRLRNLTHDTVSFKGLTPDKLKEFPDIYAYASLSKLPLSQYNSPDEIQNLAKEKLKGLINLEQYKIPDPEHTEDSDARIKKLEEWKQYITKENILTKDNPALGCIIFSAIIKDLKPNNRKQPEVLDKRALADTIGELRDATKKGGRLDFNFINKYKQNLVKGLSGLENQDVSSEAGVMTGWVRIPSKKNDPENFEANVKKMQALSCETWCTKGEGHARAYLEEGDDHLYIENGKTKVSISFKNDTISEFEDVRNNNKIPVQYIDVVKNYIKENNFKGGEKEIQQAEEAKIRFDKAKINLEPFIANNDYSAVFEHFGMVTKKLDDGKVEISAYIQPDEHFTYEDLGIKENDLFKIIKKINRGVKFRDIPIKDLGQLTEIGGDAYFANSQVENLGQLKTIKGIVYFNHSKIKNLGQLTTIGLDAHFGESQIKHLGKLTTIGKTAYFANSQVENLGQLKTIGEYAYFSDSKVKDLGQLTKIGKSVWFSNSQIESLGQLTTIGKDADFSTSRIKDLGKLEYIGGDVYFDSKTKGLDFSKVYIKGKFYEFDAEGKEKEIFKPCLNRPDGK